MRFEARNFSGDSIRDAVDDIYAKSLVHLELAYGENGENPLEYHNTLHTVGVADAAYAISNLAIHNGKLPIEDRELIMVAAVCHDAVHHPSRYPELESAEYAAEVMLEAGVFTKKDIRRVRGMIMATVMREKDGRLEQSVSKKDYAQAILADADMANLGKPFDQYWAATLALYKEKHPGNLPRIRDVASFGFGFIKQHIFYTQEANELFPHQYENLVRLEHILHTIGPDDQNFDWDEHFSWTER